jgi:hypothetical protein
VTRSVAIGALGTLSLVQWGRKLQLQGPDFVLYLLSVLPNVLSAIAIPFVLLSIWADQKPTANYQSARRIFIILLLFAGIGLITWEFMQLWSRSLYFDYHDIGATIFGLGSYWIPGWSRIPLRYKILVTGFIQHTRSILDQGRLDV